MKLQDVLGKMRMADKIAVRCGGYTLFHGNVNQCNFEKDLTNREIDQFYPETLGGLIVDLKQEGIRT